MRHSAQFAALSMAIILLLAGAASTVTGGASRQTVWVSALLAFIVQMLAFAIARSFAPAQVMVGWGLGATLRMLAAVVYGVVVAKLWRAPIAPALLSFVSFLFVTTVIEPAFLRR